MEGELRRIRSEFVQRVSDSVIKGLLDDLLQHKVLSTEEKDFVMEQQRIRGDRARCLIDTVIWKGETASQIIIDSMKKRDLHLCITLGLISPPGGVDASKIKRQKTGNQYRLTSEPTGLCVIINNENFQDGTKRKGTEKDAESLAAVFSWLGFQVLMCKDQTASDMAQVTKMLADLKDPADLKERKLEEWSDGKFTPLSVIPRHGDAFVCCVLSHGEEGVVEGVDRIALPISDIITAFNGENCSAMLGKPKVFIIQACQGDGRQGVGLQRGLVQDACLDQGKKKDHPIHPMEADFLVFMATVAKYNATRHKYRGSIFIQSLCEQLREGCARDEDILKILVNVNAAVSEKDFGQFCAWKQMPEFRVTLRHELVFSPCSS